MHKSLTTKTRFWIRAVALPYLVKEIQIRRIISFKAFSSSCFILSCIQIRLIFDIDYFPFICRYSLITGPVMKSDSWSVPGPMVPRLWSFPAEMATRMWWNTQQSVAMLMLNKQVRVLVYKIIVNLLWIIKKKDIQKHHQLMTAQRVFDFATFEANYCKSRYIQTTLWIFF